MTKSNQKPVKKDIKIKRKHKLIIAIAIIAFFIYLPPCSVSHYTNHIFVDGPSEMYSMSSLAERNKIPIVLLYATLWPSTINSYHGGHTPLYVAIDRGNIFLAKFLIWKGAADINTCYYHFPSDKTKLIHFDNAEKQKELAFYMIDHGLIINPKGKHTPLARSICDVELTKLLIENGADVNAGSPTPLEAASCCGNIEIIKLLLTKGANSNAGPPTPLEAVSGCCRIGVAKLFIKKGADASKGRPIIYATGCSEEYIQLLLDNGANINAKDEEERNILHRIYYEQRSRQYNMLPFLVKNGFDINAQDADGNTFLHYVTRTGSFPDQVELALENGANPNIKNRKGYTPYEQLLMFHPDRYEYELEERNDTIALLVKYGAIDTISDKK